ncbi:MAG TPA: alkaline phosphatase family protein [Solirubrobacteraceae bacterium]|nr:alkaline phosphatase family protein [Solirubrobacteraceae bacterium]
MSRLRRPLAGGCAIALLVSCAAALAQEQLPGRDSQLTGNGRKLDPGGRMTAVGTFPVGGAITPDGSAYWVVDAGRHAAFVHIVDLASGAERQRLPIAGGDNGIAFAPDGRHAYVSGLESDDAAQRQLPGGGGDVVHVFSIDSAGMAKEEKPIALPHARDGAAAADNLPPASGVKAWPQGVAVTPDGTTLLVVLGQADQVAIIDLASGAARLADVGRYPFAVAVDPRRSRAYVTNERDGTVSALDLPSGRVVATVPVGGPRGDAYAHPEGLAVDPRRERLYVAVADRDLLAVVDTSTLTLARLVDVSRPSLPLGVAPVSVAVAPDGSTAYVADAGEDAVAAVALKDRPLTAPQPHQVRSPRSVASIGRYRRALRRARRARDRAGRTSASRRRYAKTARRLRAGLLYGATVSACEGPTELQDQRAAAAVLRAYHARDRARRRGVPRARVHRRFLATVARARAELPALRGCPTGDRLGAKAFDVLGRIPTAAYTTNVDVSPDGRRLVWLAARGVGAGPSTNSPNIASLLEGRAGVLDRPTDLGLDPLTARADRAVVPTDRQDPPAGTPVRADGPIKHVFFVVKENRTYDQILGDDPRGHGDPRLQMFGDNGAPAPVGGVTPNVHALVRTFPLLDNVYANSEESTLGHKVTTSAYANDYTQRKVAAGRGRKGDPDIYPIGVPPNAAIFDQAVRQGVSFRVFGELGGGNQPFSDNGRPTFAQVLANTDPGYPTQVQGTCLGQVTIPNPARCSADAARFVSTVPGHSTSGAVAAQSRMDIFQAEFQAQVATGTVPRFTYMILFNNHTNGTTPGFYTPQANVADNDLALGQLAELVSHSPIWDSSAIFVLEDDSQDGLDSVDAHRIPALVISPWARRGAVVHTRYDQFSFLRTAEIISGLDPLSLNDALATPLYDAFVSGSDQPDPSGTLYQAIQPQQSLTAINSSTAPNAALSAALPWEVTDAVPQRISDRILWQSIFGSGSTPPPAGPNASPEEAGRARGALARFRAGRSVRAFLLGGGG